MSRPPSRAEATIMRPAIAAALLVALGNVGALAASPASGPAAAAAPAPAAAAPTPGAASAESAPLEDSSVRISAERAAIHARYAEQERECRTRFIVASCIDAAKRERRQELDRLKARQIAVDEARRRERATARRTELAVKAADDAKREAERAARAASAPASAASSPRGRLVPIGKARASASAASGPGVAASSAARSSAPAQGLGLGHSTPKSPSERASEEARNRAAYEARQRRAAERREDAATQSIRRMSEKNPAAPLPAPSAASAASR